MNYKPKVARVILARNRCDLSLKLLEMPTDAQPPKLVVLCSSSWCFKFLFSRNFVELGSDTFNHCIQIIFFFCFLDVFWVVLYVIFLG